MIGQESHGPGTDTIRRIQLYLIPFAITLATMAGLFELTSSDVGSKMLFARQVVLVAALVTSLAPVLLQTNQILYLGRRSRRFALSAIAFLAVAFVSALQAIDPSTAMGYAVWHGTALTISVVAIPHLIRNEIDFHIVVSGIAHALAIVVCMNIAVIFVDAIPAWHLRTGPYSGSGYSQYQGLFGSPNFLGAFVMVTVFIGFMRSRSPICSRLERTIWIGLLLAALAMLIGSRARGPMLALGLGGALLASPQRYLRWILITGLIVAAVLIVKPNIWSSSEFLQYFRIVTPSETDITAGRLGLWRQSLEASAAQPILGVGLGGESDVLVTRWQTARANSSHNSFLSIYLELGALGILSFSTAVSYGIFVNFRSATAQNLNALLKLRQRWTLAFIAALLVESVFESQFSSPGSVAYFIMWLMLGSTVRLADITVGRNQQSPMMTQKIN